MFRYAFRLPFKHPFRGAFSLPGFGTPPPIIDALLVQLEGNDDGTDLKLDSHKKPDAENFVISKSACASLNGADEFGTLSFTPHTDYVFSGRVMFFDVLDASSRVFGSYGGSEFRTYLTNQWGYNTAGGAFLIALNNTELVNNVHYYLEVSVIQNGSDVDWYIKLDGVVKASGTKTSQILSHSTTASYVGRWGSDRAPILVYDITVNGHHFRTAENSGLTSLSDDGTESITWSADPVTLWAQRQDTYSGNAIYDWWEITGDDVMYPYPVAGFDFHHKGGTFNDCESSFAPESFPIATFNGTDESALFDNLPIAVTNINSVTIYTQINENEVVFFKADGSSAHYFMHISGITTGSSNSGTPVYSVDGTVTTDLSIYIGDGLCHKIEITNLDLSGWPSDLMLNGFAGLFFSGVVRSILFSDGVQEVLVPMSDGGGTDLRDSEDNVVGAVNSSDLPAFWGGEWMVAQSIIDAEAVQGSAILTDGNGHPVPRTQTWLEDNLNVNNQHYFCEQLLLYKRVLTESEDITVKDSMPCWTIAYLLDEEGLKLYDSGYIVSVEEN